MAPKEIDPALSICNDKTTVLQRPADGEGFLLHVTGGFRAAMISKDVWMIDPVRDEGRACSKGFLSKTKLRELLRNVDLSPIAFLNFGWIGGDYYSSWSPIIPSRKNHLRGPSALWSSIASNLDRQRSEADLRAARTHEEVAKIADDRTTEGWLSRSISLSLRSMDMSVEHLSEFYHEQLINLIAAGLVDGHRTSGTQDQSFYAHVHSFFLHFGTARDYLAAIIAARLGMDPFKVDSMGRLLPALRSRHFGTDRPLDLLLTHKVIQPCPKNQNRWEISGWLKEASDLRKQFVHRRPYGARHVESFGQVIPIAAGAGLYRYFRPIVLENDVERDALDVIVSHYKLITALFQEMAETSGWDTSMLKLTDEDIQSFEVDEV